MNRTLLVIRHASTRLNNDDTAIDRLRGHSNIPLSLQGIEQAKALAKEVANTPPDVILCSDLNRCVVTAQIISEYLGIKLEEPTFNLRPWDVGDFTGRKALEVLPTMMRYVTDTPNEPLPGGESFNTFRDRFMFGMRDALERHKGLVCIVTHNRSERLLRSLEAAGWNGRIDVETFRQRGAPTGYCGIMEIPAGRLAIEEVYHKAEYRPEWLGLPPDHDLMLTDEEKAKKPK